MKTIEETEKYVRIANSEGSNVTAHNSEVLALGGTAYNVGEFSGDEESQRAHKITCQVLSEWGLEVEETEVIVVKDSEWAAKIDEEISVLLKS